MDINKLMDMVINNNINQSDVFKLIEMASLLDLKDEKNIRKIIREAARITGKDISKDKEDKMVELIKKKGITKDLINLI